MSADTPTGEGSGAPGDCTVFTNTDGEVSREAHVGPGGGASASASGGTRPAEPTESALEAAIAAAHDRLLTAKDWDDKLVHWREMVRLMDQRTVHRVRFMERIRGLA